MYDLIGDIHGHANELVQLLEQLGYRHAQGAYRHPDRRVVFLGDFIDRGPQIRRVLEIVRSMTDAGSALAVMGNHEWNALAYHTVDPQCPEQHLRRHGPLNNRQHHQTLVQLTPQELGESLEWFRTLPLWLELDGLRAVHACWDEHEIASIRSALAEHGGVTSTLLERGSRRDDPLFAAVEVVLKGKEAALPPGVSFADKDGHIRTQTRIRWYLPPQNHTYRTYALTDAIDCDLPLEPTVVATAAPYPPSAKPVFVGHYWLSSPQPATLATNVACLDYSVAKGGFLCAYRWQGEQSLDNRQFVWTRQPSKPEALCDA